MRKIEVAAGDRYGSLTIVAEVAGRSRRRMFRCECECGATTDVCLCDLRTGHTRSCGCQSKAALERSRLKHGMNGTRTHEAWMSMKARCSGRTKDAKHYSDRGISVCARWLDSFAAFFADMGECPDGKELDRIDNDGNYEPGNCRWATRIEQTRNSRHNRMLTHRGKTQCVTAWAEETGIASNTIYRRLDYGYSVAEALTLPIRQRRAARV